MDSLSRAAAVAAEKHPRLQDKLCTYGTAGFRTKAEDLDHVMYRVGLLAVLASKTRHATIGVMITASHNPEEDNGVKLIDQFGDMIGKEWEVYATQLANTTDQGIPAILQSIIDAEKIDMATQASVYIARDTRPSSVALSQAVKDGVEALGGECKDFGLLTTPQLHYIVCCQNTRGDYGSPTEDGYYDKLAKAFISLQSEAGNQGNYTPKVFLDAANGIGAPKVKEMARHISKYLQLDVVNDGSQGKLNYKCGADYVKIQQCVPEGMKVEPGMRCVSFDGDADRIVYFYLDDQHTFHLMDGDKIATLVAGFLQELVSGSCLCLNLGLVQTAYANGSSTDFITQKMKVPVACVPTGVKHLHHKAQDFDIGVYFEANGHGTVLFSKSAREKIRNQSKDKSLSPEQQKFAVRLSNVMDVINQTVGDAMSDLLLVEVILSHKGWSVADWDRMYTDLPNRQIKINVKDRTIIQTTDAERRVTSPAGLQEAIDRHVAEFPNGRSFARPSGTEDVVRVYAEADTQANADQLAYKVGLAVYEIAGGVGSKPSAP